MISYLAYMKTFNVHQKRAVTQFSTYYMKESMQPALRLCAHHIKYKTISFVIFGEQSHW